VLSQRGEANGEVGSQALNLIGFASPRYDRAKGSSNRFTKHAPLLVSANSCVVAKPDIYWANTSNFRLVPRPENEETGGLIVFAEEDCGGEDGGPEAALIAYGGLGDVHGADDLIGDSVDFFFFVPG